MLPAEPKIFHGRDSELQNVVTSLLRQSARIAILGAGGMGKSSLATAVLHHPDVAAKYEHRCFVATDSVTTSIELAALIGSHLGLEIGQDLTKAVVQSLSRGPPCLLVLDNLETAWEPLESRGGVEEFLSLLTDIPHLALIITMRGAQRPGKIGWTRPFLEPLKPLSYAAARQTFVEIADDCHDNKDIDQLLQLTGNLPLAVDLIANLVHYEGCSNVLIRWETEKTSLLSDGYDKRSSLDASIAMSLAGTRMTSCPGAKDLLSLLSILPDGILDIELLQNNIPIQDIMWCRSTLLCTSLAYYDTKKWLKSLVPIREHIHSFYPPSQSLFHPLCKHFHLLLDLYQKYHGLHQTNSTINQINLNLGNLQQLLLLELHSENPVISDAINCTVSLCSFRRVTNQHIPIILLNHIQAVFTQPSDHQLKAKVIIELIRSHISCPNINLQVLIDQGMTHFDYYNYNPALKCEFNDIV
ncbi:P-loop containing nucleoside triphosphate hydrolase protein [Mycena epipterygia]|nr:P-loop containing nucleoside triphosphate hydrolase protein [Mycena epipterygia]